MAWYMWVICIVIAVGISILSNYEENKRVERKVQELLKKREKDEHKS